MTQTFFLCATLFVLVTTSAVAADQQPFKDVPAEHWAADAVKKMRDSGIMKGYPDKNFKGEKPVTRYELAITLRRFVEFIEASRKPLVKQKPESKTAPKPEPTPGKAASHCVSGFERSGNPETCKASLDYLISGGFLPSYTPLAKDGNRAVDTDLLARCLTTVVARLAALEADREASKKTESSNEKTSP